MFFIKINIFFRKTINNNRNYEKQKQVKNNYYFIIISMNMIKLFSNY